MLWLAVLLAAILVLTLVKPALNPGLVALTCALLLAPLVLKKPPSIAFQIFPSSLFMTLFGVTFFFAGIHSTGLLKFILSKVIHISRGYPKILPFLLFLFVASLTAIGLGNIGTIALIAPLAMPLAVELGYSHLSIAILIVGAANAASFSPLTLPGIFTNDFIQKSIFLSEKLHPETMRWWLFLLTFMLISAISLLGFFLTRGKHGKQHRLHLSAEQNSNHPTFAKLSPRQKKTAFLSAGLGLTFVLASLIALPVFSQSMPKNILLIIQRFNDVGFIGWLGSLLLVSFGVVSAEDTLKQVPWSTLLMVCGMSTYIELLTQSGLNTWIVQPLQANVSEHLLTGVFALSAGGLSAFSSSVGVVLPLFMPIVEEVSKSLSAGLCTALVLSVAIGSHLVDASPLSTLGALCLAQIKNQQDRNKLYQKMLLWGFAMIPVAGVLGVLLDLLWT
ncbi:SLC13 family permease [bacterium]|nr:SLC13 family permease [bacterium]